MDSLPAEPQGSQWLNGDLSKLVHSGSQNSNLLENRFFVDVITYITMRSYWIRKSFRSKVANVILREEDAEKFTKGRGRSLETPRSQKRQARNPSEGAWLCPHLCFGLVASGTEIMKSCSFKYPVCGSLLHNPRKLIHSWLTHLWLTSQHRNWVECLWLRLALQSLKYVLVDILQEVCWTLVYTMEVEYNPMQSWEKHWISCKISMMYI